MTDAIVFSRNRAAQLDLLLTSLNHYNPELADRVTVLWRGDSHDFRSAYMICAREHSNVGFQQETEFPTDLRGLLANLGDYAAFFCDDDVFYREIPGVAPQALLERHPEVLTVSLRLGFNTQSCYSLRQKQGLPSPTHHWEDGFIWTWYGQSGDWGYPGSLDGNVWRTAELKALLAEANPENPNCLEEDLNEACHRFRLKKMACYRHSALVGNAVNVVNDTHQTNRHGEQFPYDPKQLNNGYLNGFRIKNTVAASKVDAAHTEQPLTLA